MKKIEQKYRVIKSRDCDGQTHVMKLEEGDEGDDGEREEEEGRKRMVGERAADEEGRRVEERHRGQGGINYSSAFLSSARIFLPPLFCVAKRRVGCARRGLMCCT